jgi:hypothetical protein
MKKELEHRIFEEKNANIYTKYGIAGYSQIEDANEYAKLFKKYWGSNLIILQTQNIDGYFFPQFNVFD